jgi:hypothetical protein
MEGLDKTPNFDEAGIEKLKYHYFYYNNELAGHPVIFDCKADNVSDADKQYKEKIGKEPNKSEHIGCIALEN